MSASKITKKLGSLFLTALLLGPVTAFADYALNMTESVSVIGKDIYDLHMLVLWICTAAGILVFGVIIWSIIFQTFRNLLFQFPLRLIIFYYFFLLFF